MVEKVSKSPPKFDKRCGSTSGYYVHKRRKEFACQPCRDALAAYSKEWRVKYPEKGKVYFATGKMKHPDKNKEKHARWAARNPEKVVAWNKSGGLKRRDRKANAESEPYTTQQILDIYGAGCHICHEPIDLAAPRMTNLKGWERGLHLDHVVPFALGGTDLISNVKPSHGICNAKKWMN